METHRRSPFSQLKTALIFPGSRGKTTEDALVRAYEGSTILSCTTSGGYQLGLLFGTGQPSAVQPSPPAPGTWYLMYFYGNGMCLETSCYEFAQFRQLGCTVLIPEYPGYGMSSGWASESGCYEAADAAYHYLTETLHAHPAQIVVAGWSLGAAVAIDLAARKQVAGLIVLGAFTNLPEQAHAMLPWVSTWVVRLFIRERFDNVSKIRQVTCPIFIGHGTEDELVPFAMAERLAQAARQRGPVTFLPLQRCSHNGIFEASRGCVWTAIKDFSTNLWPVDTHTDERSGTVSWSNWRVRLTRGSTCFSARVIQQLLFSVHPWRADFLWLTFPPIVRRCCLSNTTARLSLDCNAIRQ